MQYPYCLGCPFYSEKYTCSSLYYSGECWFENSMSSESFEFYKELIEAEADIIDI